MRSTRVIKRFGKTFTVKRKGAGHYTGGKWVQDAADTTFEIVAVQSPVKTSELQVLPEGTRIDTVWKLTTETPLQTNMPASGATPAQAADVVVIDGKSYQVLMPLNWATHEAKAIKLAFYEVVVQLLEVQP